MARTLAPYIAIQSGWPSLWVGGPGTGKTQHTYGLARSLKEKLAALIDGDDPFAFPLEELVLATRDPTDVIGLTLIGDNGTTMIAVPDWFANLEAAGRGILFLDELSCAAPATQAAALKVVNERKVGSRQLPESVWVVASMNPAAEAAGGWELAPPMANRFWHYNWTVDVPEWVEGFMNDFPDPEVKALPENWRIHKDEYRGLIAGFIRSRQEMLYRIPEDESDAAKAWPSPRTWDMTADLLAAAKAYGTDSDTERELVTGSVGQGPGFELLNYVNELDLPDPEDLLSNPEAFRLPPRGDQQFAVFASVAAAVIGTIDNSHKLSDADDRWMAAWRIYQIAAEAGATDVAAAAVRKLCERWKGKDCGLTTPRKELDPFVEVLAESGLLGHAK